MKIAMLSWESMHSIAVGGIAPHVTELSAALHGLGHDVHVFTRRREGQKRYDHIDGVHYHRCAYVGRPEFVDDMIGMADSFAWHVGEVEHGYGEPFDVVHGHDWMTTPALVRLKNERGRRIVMTIHSTEYGRCGNELFWHGQSKRIRDLEWEGTYVADRVICVSESLRKETMWLYSLPADKTKAIYNGVDAGRFDIAVDVEKVRRSCSVGMDDPCVLFAGRLAWQKGPDLLLEAIPGVLDQCAEAKFVFAGDGDMRSQLESRTATAGIRDAVRFVGYRSGADLVGLFKSSDIVCVPSRNEPFGIVILEAWSASKPVVATRTGGPAEFVRHRHTGWTVPSDVASIGEGLRAVLEDDDRAKRMGINGRREAETRFSWNTIASQTESVYQSIVDRKSDRSALLRSGSAERDELIAPTETKAAKRNGSSRSKARGSARASTVTAVVSPAEAAVARVESTRPRVEPTESEIRRRAFEIYLSRNGGPGNAATDWAQAERELRGEHSPAKGVF